MEACKQNIVHPLMASMEQNFGENMPQLRASCIFGGPAGGSRTRKNAFAPRRFHYHMACRDGDCIRTRRAILYSTTAGQIVAKSVCGFWENFVTKPIIAQSLAARFW